MFKHEVEFGSEANTGSGEGGLSFFKLPKGGWSVLFQEVQPSPPPPVYTSVVSLYVWKDKKCRLEFFVQYWTNIFDNSVDLIIFYCIWSFWIGLDRFLLGFDWSDRFWLNLIVFAWCLGRDWILWFCNQD